MKKFVSLLLALMMALSLVACGSKADTKTDDKTDDDTVTGPANALEKIKADGVLTVALSPDFSPMEFVDSSKTGQDQYVGFDITLAKYIAENLGVELVIEPMGFDASQTAVYTGSVPMSISGYSWTEDRAQNYELSDYYYAGENETRQALLIKKENADKYTSPEDLAGQDVGAQNASLQMQLVTEQLTGADPVAIGDITVGVMELKSGNIEALAVAYGNAEMIVDANPDLVICTWEFDVKAEYDPFQLRQGLHGPAPAGGQDRAGRGADDGHHHRAPLRGRPVRHRVQPRAGEGAVRQLLPAGRTALHGGGARFHGGTVRHLRGA